MKIKRIKSKLAVIAEKEQPKWNLYKDGLTQSFINSFLQCKETTRLRYIENWRPKKKSPWFEFGTLFHYCIEQAFKDQAKYDYPNDLPLGACPNKGHVSKWIEKYNTEVKNPNEFLDSEEIEYSEIIYALAEKMLPIYFQLRVNDFKNKIIFNETEFDLIARWRSENSCIRLRGKIDLGWIEPEDDFWLLDTKCLSVIQPETIAGIMPFDIQCMFYLLAAYQLGHNPKGIKYNIIRRPQHRKRKDESISSFTDRIMEDVVDNPAHFFLRLSMSISKEEVEKWKNEPLNEIIDEIVVWQTNNFKSYVNPNSLQTKYGKSQYFNAITQNDFSSFYKSDKVFSELGE